MLHVLKFVLHDPKLIMVSSARVSMDRSPSWYNMMPDCTHMRTRTCRETIPTFLGRKPVTFALPSQSDKLDHQESCDLDYTYKVNICHIDGSRNEVVDAFSRPLITPLQLTPGIDLAEMAGEPRRVSSPYDKDAFELELQDFLLPTEDGCIFWEVATVHLCRHLLATRSSLL
ncbi:unnamed protein product [Dibothriocephalus latus]|uniref:Uncharacterized protein n=1 Tax=Dibothriocephalus latus TaxID=60516 RepID=A0A3P7M6F8_DIBLA|nr:unnamed protein product [Dibothriocephalus latus]